MNNILNEPRDVTDGISHMSILYVDDNAASTSTMSHMLSGSVKNLTLASGGREAIGLFSAEKHDLVITVAHMKDMGGLVLANAIRKIDPSMPILMILDEDCDSSFLRDIEVVIDKLITKPLRRKNLIKIITKISNTLVQQKRMKVQNRLIRSLLDINPVYLAVCSNGGLAYLNKSFQKYLGVSSLAEFKERYGELVPLIVDRDPGLSNDLQLCRWAVDNTSSGIGYVLQLHLPQYAEGHSFLLTTVPVLDSSEGEYLLTFTDITHLEKEKQHLQYLTEYDTLTKAFNRGKINKEMDKEIARVQRYRGRLSVLMIDIDHFKMVNDTFGHQAGDVVLTELVALLKDRIRKTDILGRYGGEEFILLMPSTPLDSAAEIAERLRKSIAAFEFTGIGTMTCSIGVAEFQAGESADTFIKRSDDALYAAKRNGRNRVETAG